MLEIQPVAGALGAEVRGVDLRGPISDTLYQAIRSALVDHQVLFFHDQCIETAHQKALAQRFGPLQTHPAYDCVEGFPEVTVLESSPEKPTRLWFTP